jgi:hypothetical protein
MTNMLHDDMMALSLAYRNIMHPLHNFNGTSGLHFRVRVFFAEEIF